MAGRAASAAKWAPTATVPATLHKPWVAAPPSRRAAPVDTWALYEGDADNESAGSAPLDVVVTPLPSVAVRHSPNTPHKPNPKAGPRYTVVFVDGAAAVTFYCRLDRRKWQSCGSPKVYRKLKRGRHVFRLKSVDAAGSVSPVRVIRFFAGKKRAAKRRRR